MSDERRSLLDLIGSVADGATVDWSQELDSETDPEQRQLLETLRLIGNLTAAPAVAPRPAHLPAGRYGHIEVRKLLATGAHADVYHAHDHRLRRDIALKVLAADAGRWRGAAARSPEAFLEEARRLARVRHPNVVVIYALESIDGHTALAVEYLDGMTLAELLARDGAFGASELIALGGQLCAALSAVHAVGLVHEDIKAQNVMRESGGRIVLMDFGTGGVTPLYMAPELFEGEAPSPRSDLYALGVLLFHLATGEYPVTARSLDELREAQAAGRRRRLLDLRPDMPSQLAAVIDRASSAEPSERFATPGELAAALTASAQQSSVATGAARAPFLAPRSWAVATVLVLAVALLWIFQRGDDAVTDVATAPPTSISEVAAAAESFRIEAAFYRGDRVRERLEEGAQVALGDSISLSITSSDSLYVYVLNQDDQGAAYLLFPSPRFQPSNPLPPASATRLPGQLAGQPFYWQITSPAKEEQLLLLASRRRLATLEADALQMARPQFDAEIQFQAVSPEFLDELRGMGGYAAGAGAAAQGEAPASTAQLLELALPLRQGPDQAQGVWIRKLTLRGAG